jgi:hypothetical protein
MRIIFESETELAKCDYETGGSQGFRYAEPDYATLFARTEASLVGKKMLKIEQHCYLRGGEDLPEQPWVKPRVVLEPILDLEEEMAEVARRMHDLFVQIARQQLPEQLVA